MDSHHAVFKPFSNIGCFIRFNLSAHCWLAFTKSTKFKNNYQNIANVPNTDEYNIFVMELKIILTKQKIVEVTFLFLLFCERKKKNFKGKKTVHKPH